MTNPHGPHNTQHNQAHQMYAVNGGNQTINQTNTNIYQSSPAHQSSAPRPKTGRALLIMIVIDAVFFVYGAVAYTGQGNNPGDLGRAVVFLILLATTGTLLRRWIRSRF
jgi:hypothetical protein